METIKISEKSLKKFNGIRRKKILKVFRSYCDAYLEYVNNWLTWEKFVEFFELDEKECENLLQAVKMMNAQDNTAYNSLDYFYHKVANTKFSEKNSCFD